MKKLLTLLAVLFVITVGCNSGNPADPPPDPPGEEKRKQDSIKKADSIKNLQTPINPIS